MYDRPYSRETTAVLQERAEDAWRAPDELHTLYVELLHRQRKAARDLRALLEERLQAFKEYFDWPTTHAPESEESLDGTVFKVQVGLLGFMGYRVGQDGITQASRRAILEDVYLRRVPPVKSADYMAEWGKPRTATRLKKTANVLAASSRNAKRKKLPALSKSVLEWESDLAYLKSKFYVGVYSFKWPDTAA